jgi:large subunit ribosomal protein L31
LHSQGRAIKLARPFAPACAHYPHHAVATTVNQIKGVTMKAGIHPEYREVVFQDISSDFAILTRSTVESKETIKWEDGNEYPLVKVEVSSASHPFYTGQHKVLDSGGRVDRFKKRYGK